MCYVVSVTFDVLMMISTSALFIFIAHKFCCKERDERYYKHERNTSNCGVDSFCGKYLLVEKESRRNIKSNK